MNKTQLEIFCGTGGVGKTTLSLTRAMYLSEFKDVKIALITIDPAKRLKDLIGISEKESGHMVSKYVLDSSKPIDVMLMNPEVTFNKMRNPEQAATNNRILSLLMKPYGGMNEIMSAVELKEIIDLNIYDVVILDTPPGAHFIDFLKSLGKINQFFDSSWISAITILSKSVTTKVKSPSFLRELTTSGIKKVLKYLEKVTGKDFIDEFVEALSQFYSLKNRFTNALNLQELFQDPKQSKWFLVTAVDQTKLEQAQELRRKSQQYAANNVRTLINKAISPHFSTEQIESSPIARYFVKNENKLLKNLVNNNSKPFLFPEVVEEDFNKQIKSLVNYWENYDY